MLYAAGVVCVGAVILFALGFVWMYWEKKQKEGFEQTYRASAIENLNAFLASIDMLCIKSRARSINLNTPSFYEHHTFLNLTVEYLQKTSYEIAERIKSLGGTSNYSYADIGRKSMVDDANVLLETPKEIYMSLLPDYERLSEFGQEIFGKAAKVQDAGTIALVTGVTKQLEHFEWEIAVMAGVKKRM